MVATQNETNQMGIGFGPGVLISETGIVLTNYHVIHRAEVIRVWFYNPDDSNYSYAKVIGIDPVADLALLQLELDPDIPPPVYLEIEQETPVIAEPVVAIGHPVGLQWTVTTGSINHQARPGKITPYVNVIQHSAEINKGNSGGPLINANGDIVGINTYMLAPEGQWAGVAYAIRGDTVHHSVEQKLEDGDVEYGGSFDRFDKPNLDFQYTMKTKFTSLPPEYWKSFGIKNYDLIKNYNIDITNFSIEKFKLILIRN